MTTFRKVTVTETIERYVDGQLVERNKTVREERSPFDEVEELIFSPADWMEQVSKWMRGIPKMHGVKRRCRKMLSDNEKWTRCDRPQGHDGGCVFLTTIEERGPKDPPICDARDEYGPNTIRCFLTAGHPDDHEWVLLK